MNDTNKIDEIFNNLTIDKRVILGNIDQELAFSRLLGNQEVSTSTRALNILREESQSSIRFMWTDDNRLYARDFANIEYTGDLVEWTKFYSRDVEKRLITTNQALTILQEGIDDIDISKKLDDYIHIESDKINSIIDIEAKLDNDGYALFDGNDLEYWGQFGITKQTEYILRMFGIFSCRKAWIHKKDYTEAFTDSRTPIYAYYFDEGKYKIYMPYAKKEYKWRCNHSLVDDFGINKESKFIILTKSRKDRVVWKLLGYEAYCFSAEIVPNELPYKTDIVFYDNDYTKPIEKNIGLLRGKEISNKFKIPHLFIPSKYECTDLAEMVEKYGLHFTRNIVNDMISKYL